MPSLKTIDQLKVSLLNPSTTSHFEVQIVPPGSMTRFFSQNGIIITGQNDKLNLLCCEASLPGSSFATLESTNDRTGVTERHAYRRIYDDRIDLTFYVDSENYTPIRFFETWMKYIAQESIAEGDKPSSRSGNYFYRFQYVDNYSSEGLQVTKFEKSSRGYASSVRGKQSSSLTYGFVKSFPISVSSMPVSYDSSSLLKCTVSMTYIRYYLTQAPDPIEDSSDSIGQNAFYKPLNNINVFDPNVQAKLNGLNLPTLNPGTYNYDFNKIQSVDIGRSFGSQVPNLF